MSNYTFRQRTRSLHGLPPVAHLAALLLGAALGCDSSHAGPDGGASRTDGGNGDSSAAGEAALLDAAFVDDASADVSRGDAEGEPLDSGASRDARDGDSGAEGSGADKGDARDSGAEGSGAEGTDEGTKGGSGADGGFPSTEEVGDPMPDASAETETESEPELAPADKIVEVELELPDICESLYLDVHGGYCFGQTLCSGQTATARCATGALEADGTALWSCSCQNALGTTTAWADGVDAASLCPAFIERCAQNLPLVPEADAVAECSSEVDTTYAESDTTCFAAADCRYNVGIGDGVALFDEGRASLRCSPTTDGRDALQCSCLLPWADSYTLEMDSRSVAPNCGELLGSCTTGDIRATGAVECSLQFLSELDWDCAAREECEQPGLLGQVDVHAFTEVETYCYNVEGDVWDCGCSTRAGYVPDSYFSVKAEGGTVCQSARGRCGELAFPDGLIAPFTEFAAPPDSPVTPATDAGTP